MNDEQFDQPTCHRCGVRVYSGEDLCPTHEEEKGEGLDPLCANCAYETSEVDEVTGFCDTCLRAYEIGKEEGKK